MGHKGSDLGISGMDTLIGDLADVREEFILEIPLMVFGFYGCPDSI